MTLPKNGPSKMQTDSITPTMTTAPTTTQIITLPGGDALNWAQVVLIRRTSAEMHFRTTEANANGNTYVVRYHNCDMAQAVHEMVLKAIAECKPLVRVPYPYEMEENSAVCPLTKRTVYGERAEAARNLPASREERGIIKCASSKGPNTDKLTAELIARDEALTDPWAEPVTVEGGAK